MSLGAGIGMTKVETPVSITLPNQSCGVITLEKAKPTECCPVKTAGA
jgi:hypothetical protein